MGVIVGMIYTWLVLFLLGTVWKGATHTGGFELHLSIQAIMIGMPAGIIISVCLLWIVLRRSLHNTTRHKSQKRISLCRKLIHALIISLLVIVIATINLANILSVVLFVIIGMLFVVVAACWGDYLICRKGISGDKPLTASDPVWKTLFAGRKQVMLSFFPLAMGVFIVFSVGLNRQGFADESKIVTATGGYTLWCESSVPVYHNLSTQFGREKLGLTELPAGTEVLQCYRYGADDASCLNLNKVSNPTVLGVEMEQLSRSRFKIDRIWGETGKENRFEAF
jgi:putative ABC transport system permease protein